MPTRPSTAIAAAAALVLVGSAAALAAGDPTPTAPPRIAFVANAFNPADALAVGPVAGQLGAPLCTTAADTLSEGAADCLTGFAPELVLVAGGPGAIADGVLDQIRTATGLTGDAVDRVFGTGRTETAAALATLLADRGIDSAFLPVDATATDADLLDGLDATAFQPVGDYALADQACTEGQVVTGIAANGTPTCSEDEVDGGDAATLDGADASAFVRTDQLEGLLPLLTFFSTSSKVLRFSFREPVTGPPTLIDLAPGRHDVDIPGVTYFFTTFATVCTTAESGVTIAVTSAGGNLRVMLDDADGPTDSSFQCAVYQPTGSPD